MNGTEGPVIEERVTRKRQLEADLQLVRTQKAEVLRSIQQIAKKQKLGGPPTSAQHLSHEAKITNAKLDHARRSDIIFGTCVKIVQEILKNAQIKVIFGQPVNRDLYPNYYSLIDVPMDLGTVRAKLDAKAYADVYAFRDDVRLVWANCRKFNPVGDQVRKMGDNASDSFEQKWLKYQVEANWEMEARRHALEMEKLEAEAKTLPEKLKEVNAELQELNKKAAEREETQPPGPTRDMTFEEKRKLSHALGQLPGERLTRAIEIIMEGPSAPDNAEDDEFELDIDALDRVTQWKIQSYVDSVLAELAAKAPKPPAPLADGAAPSAGTAKPEGSESQEGVGSKGNDGSAMAGGQEADAAKRGQDMTTFVSATGPGAQPQILKNSSQKKDVQLQNAGAWSNLPSAPAAADTAEAGKTDAPPVEDENLWTEFQGREAQQKQAEEVRLKAEEEERQKKEAEAAEQRRVAEEAQRKAAEEAEAKKKEEEQRTEAEKEALQKELAEMKSKGEEERDHDMLRHAGHESQADLADLGLAAPDDEAEPMEEI